MSARRFTLLLSLMLLTMPGPALAQDEASAIREVVLDYVEGWWTGDAERMASSLHPDLVKRIPSTHRETGRSLLNSSTKSDMVEYTRAGGGSANPEQKGEVEVVIVDVSGDIANVIATSDRYIDYLHLVKWNDRWVILNVLWGAR